VVLREIRIETGIQAVELNHQWRTQIDIIYLAMYRKEKFNLKIENY